MGRIYIEPEAEANLQEPIVKAIEAYFDQAYTPDSEYASVGTLTGANANKIIMYTAFRVPEQYAQEALVILQAFGDKLAALGQVPGDG